MNTISWVAIASAVIAVFSVAIRFDLNRFLENRKSTQFAKVQAMCPHCVLEPTEDGRIAVRGLSQSPPGTLQAQCTRCHRVFVGGLDETWEALQYWRANPKELIKAEKQFRRYAKRTGFLVE